MFSTSGESKNDYNEDTQLHIACWNGNITVVKGILEIIEKK